MVNALKLFRIFTIFIFSMSVLCNHSYAGAKYDIADGFSKLVDPLLPAVVNISTVQKAKSRSAGAPGPRGNVPLERFLEKFFDEFGGSPPNWNHDDEGSEAKKIKSLGSGFIIDSAGHIVTNYHVIMNADEITIKLNGSTKEFVAKVVGIDQKTDLAVLKIESSKPLPFVKFGDSDKSKVGDWVIAIGNPFGLGSTVTSGIISANGRDIASEGIIDNFIQTDAAINRGSSGGPMFNTNGEVIGVNTIIISNSGGGNIGIGFAMPSSMAESIIEKLKNEGKIKRGILGIRMQPVTKDIADSLGMKNVYGVLIVEVGKDTAAEKAGLEIGDILTSFDSKKVESVKKFVKMVSTAPVGKEMKLSVLRSGDTKNLQVVLEEDKEDAEALNKKQGIDNKDKKFSEYYSKEIMGASIARISPSLREKFNIDQSVDGLVVLNYTKGSIWYKRGLRPGDIIVSANQVDLNSVDQLEKIIKFAKKAKRKSVLLLVGRGKEQMFIPLPIAQSK